MSRIIQITDCHLLADPQATVKGICTRDRFNQVLARVNARYPISDRLIITGDLTHDERLETYQTIRELLAAWSPWLHVIPGNHDDRGLIRQVFPVRSRPVEDRYVFIDYVGKWKLIGLDSHVPGHLHGELGAAQIQWLQQEVQTAAEPHIALFVHHPPIAMNSPWMDQISLTDANLLWEIVARDPRVRLISCGHVHQERMELKNGVAVFTTPSTGVQFRPETETLEVDDVAPGFRIIDLHQDGTITTRVERVPLHETPPMANSPAASM